MTTSLTDYPLKVLTWIPICCFSAIRGGPNRGGCVRRLPPDRQPIFQLPGSRIDFANRKSLTRPSTPTSNEISSFHVLPLEIRRRVWMYALGGTTFRLRMNGVQLIGNRCVVLEPGNPRGTTHQEKRLQRREDVLALLLTCRQIYMEAIEYLYSENYFVTDETVMSSLPLMLLPNRVDSIRSLRVIMRVSRPPYDPHLEITNHDTSEVASALLQLAQRRYEDWKIIWQNISAMQSLKDLRVELEGDIDAWPYLNREKAVELLSPIMQVTRPKQFVLRFPVFFRDDRFVTDTHNILVDRYWNGVDQDPWDELSGICRIEGRNRSS